MRRRIALAFISSALILSIGLVGYSLMCGAKQVEATEPGAEAAEPRCVPDLHPGTLILTAGSGAAFVAAVAARRVPALVAAGATLVAGLAFALSMGAWGLLVGILLLAGAGMLPPAGERVVGAE